MSPSPSSLPFPALVLGAEGQRASDPDDAQWPGLGAGVGAVACLWVPGWVDATQAWKEQGPSPSPAAQDPVGEHPAGAEGLRREMGGLGAFSEGLSVGGGPGGGQPRRGEMGAGMVRGNSVLGPEGKAQQDTWTPAPETVHGPRALAPAACHPGICPARLSLPLPQAQSPPHPTASGAPRALHMGVPCCLPSTGGMSLKSLSCTPRANPRIPGPHAVERGPQELGGELAWGPESWRRVEKAFLAAVCRAQTPRRMGRPVRRTYLPRKNPWGSLCWDGNNADVGRGVAGTRGLPRSGKAKTTLGLGVAPTVPRHSSASSAGGHGEGSQETAHRVLCTRSVTPSGPSRWASLTLPWLRSWSGLSVLGLRFVRRKL